ncbi:MAG: hypothetical protein ABJB05_07815 [Parafilimonas sp.]
MLLLSYKQEELKLLPEKFISIQEIISYLTRLNDNVMVYVKEINTGDIDGIKIYEMSNGSLYKNENGNWIVL